MSQIVAKCPDALKDQVLQNVLDCCKMSWVVAKCPGLLQNVLGCLLVDLQSVDQLKSSAVFCFRLCSSLMDRFVKRVAPGSFCQQGLIQQIDEGFHVVFLLILGGQSWQCQQFQHLRCFVVVVEFHRVYNHKTFVDSIDLMMPYCHSGRGLYKNLVHAGPCQLTSVIVKHYTTPLRQGIGLILYQISR